MLTAIIPKLPMRNLEVTRHYYQQLGFHASGNEYPDYLIMQRDQLEVHFFLCPDLNPLENYGQVYLRTRTIDALYSNFRQKVEIHPNGDLASKPWGQREFSLLDPDHNLLTFGQQL